MLIKYKYKTLKTQIFTIKLKIETNQWCKIKKLLFTIKKEFKKLIGLLLIFNDFFSDKMESKFNFSSSMFSFFIDSSMKFKMIFNLKKSCSIIVFAVCLLDNMNYYWCHTGSWVYDCFLESKLGILAIDQNCMYPTYSCVNFTCIPWNSSHWTELQEDTWNYENMRQFFL